MLQKLGRGGRTEEGKTNCLLLDHAGNIPTLGCINDPIIPRKKGDKGGDIPIKICEACGVYNHIKAVKCDPCGHPFEFKIKIVERAGTEQPLKQVEAPQIEYRDITYVTYAMKQKAMKPAHIKVTYFTPAMEAYTEFVFPENKGFRKPYYDWWRMRHRTEPPSTTHECMAYIGELRAPRRIRVHLNKMVNGKNWPEVLSAEW